MTKAMLAQRLLDHINNARTAQKNSTDILNEVLDILNIYKDPVQYLQENYVSKNVWFNLPHIGEVQITGAFASTYFFQTRDGVEYKQLAPFINQADYVLELRSRISESVNDSE